MLKVGIVGATGYTGVELLRLLAVHPQVEVRAVTSRKEAGKPLTDLFPSLRGHYDLCFVNPDETPLDDCDLVCWQRPSMACPSSIAPPLPGRGWSPIRAAIPRPRHSACCRWWQSRAWSTETT